MADFKIDDTVDITTVVCPTTFVKAKVALEELDDGQILSIKMNDGEPVQNVPRSIKDVAEGLTVAQLVIDENVETPQYVTVTINDEFVESGAFESTVLKDGDVVEFLYFMGGGQ